MKLCAVTFEAWAKFIFLVIYCSVSEEIYYVNSENWPYILDKNFHH